MEINATFNRFNSQVFINCKVVMNTKNRIKNTYSKIKYRINVTFFIHFEC